MAIGRIPEPGTGIPESIVDAKGDLVTATAADTPARLAVGTNEHRLVAASGETTGLKYVADTTNYAIAAKGDLLVGTAADTLQALSVGTNGHTLVADSSTSTGLKWAAPAGGGGKVLQVVQSVITTATAITSTNLTDTSITATITPTVNTSKILVLVDAQVMITRNDPNLYGGIAIIRDSTNVYDRSNEAAVGGYFGTQSGFEVVHNFCLNYLDSPATTSATTYKVQYKRSQAGGTATFQRSSTPSSITLLEIGA